ncbi:MAG: hypothetical protein PHQ43_10890 [Dehalococcoidales bacterium]|nr:hypothetical protein [Dehalococcoidales bacterium]
MFVVNLAFPLGRLVMTRGVNDLVADDKAFAKFITDSLARHVKGDWGDVDDEDRMTNDQSLKQGLRLLSAYNDDRFPKNGISTIWIITEADRSATTILFPDEY